MAEGILKMLAESIASSVLDGRAKLANFAGLTFGGNRDMYAALGYPRVITNQMYRWRFDRGGMAGRIVEAMPEDTWRGGFEIIERDDAEKLTTFEQAASDFIQRFNLGELLQNTDTLAGVAHYSVLVLGAPGELNTPLESCSPELLHFLTPYWENDCAVYEFDVDTQSERFGLPLYYTLKRTAATNKTNTPNQTLGKKVHWSRVIHVADDLLDDRVYARPRLERVWNLLDDLDKVTGGGAEAFWKRAHQGVHFDIDPEMKVNDDDVTALKEKIEQYKHGMDRYPITRGVTMTPLGSDVANLTPSAEGILQQISGTIGIPTRVLLGSEQGKLAADQDSVKYYRRVEARRAGFAANLVRMVFNRMIELGVLPEPQADYEIRWSQIRTLDDDERLTLAMKAKGLGPEVISDAEIRDIYLGLDPMEESAKRVEPSVAARKESSSKSVHRAADRFRRTREKVGKAGVRRRTGIA